MRVQVNDFMVASRYTCCMTWSHVDAAWAIPGAADNMLVVVTCHEVLRPCNSAQMRVGNGRR